MMAQPVTVQDCAVCRKPCDSVEATIDPATGSIFVIAKCHGKEDSHTVEKSRLQASRQIILIPFAK